MPMGGLSALADAFKTLFLSVSIYIKVVWCSRTPQGRPRADTIRDHKAYTRFPPTPEPSQPLSSRNVGRDTLASWNRPLLSLSRPIMNMTSGSCCEADPKTTRLPTSRRHSMLGHSCFPLILPCGCCWNEQKRCLPFGTFITSLCKRVRPVAQGSLGLWAEGGYQIR